MNQQTKQAERLHRLLADTDGLTNAELRRMLQVEGVDVNAYLERLRPAAPKTGQVAPSALPQVPAVECTEELRLAARKRDPKSDSRHPH